MKPNHEPIKVKSTVVEAVKSLQKFMDTYDTQGGYSRYAPKTYIDDVLYGLAISLNPKYEWHKGYQEFKADLLKYLQHETTLTDRIKKS